MMTLLFAGLVATSVQAQTYPPEWWAPVPESEKESWEILPQEAGPGEVILSKRTELGVFSNLAPTPFVFEDVAYASLEGFWQMMKYPEGPSDPRWTLGDWPYTREQVRALSGFEAKHAGDAANAINKPHGIRWISYNGERIEAKDGGAGSARHAEWIEAATRAKLEQNPAVKELLLRTRGLKLRMDHHIEETFPAYQTAQMLMDLREEYSAPPK